MEEYGKNIEFLSIKWLIFSGRFQQELFKNHKTQSDKPENFGKSLDGFRESWNDEEKVSIGCWLRDAKGKGY